MKVVMSDELRAAADSDSHASCLRRAFEQWICSPPYEMSIARLGYESWNSWPGHYRDINVQRAFEAWTTSAEMCQTLLAEHPADDDEPVTEEWLTSQNLWETQIVGIHERPTFVRYLRFTYRILGVGDSGCVALLQSMSGKEEIEIRLNTRRQVRDLIRVLKGGE